MMLMFGVVAPHDDIDAGVLLDQLVTWFEEQTEVPLVIESMFRDCLVGPEERGNAHVEVRWLKMRDPL